MAFSSSDRQFMARALQLARRGLFTTDPNPRVGCVLVKDGRIVGEGWHERAGEAHAERHALEKAADNARGATCYVTLEPCSHQGRTGPCADALIQAGVTRVVVAMQDPNPQVAGQGMARLKTAGVRLESGLMQTQAEALNPGFIARHKRGRPWLRVKLAISLDGRTAMANGESQWITGPAAREDVQHWRAQSSAIITGMGTLLADDPSLTVRPWQWQFSDYGDAPVRQPLRVLLDSNGRTPVDAALLQAEGSSLLVTASDAASQALAARGLESIRLPGADGHVDLSALLAELARRECNELLLEAGPELCAAFLRAGLVDELLVYQAPVLLGSSARPMFALPEIEQMADNVTLQLQEWRKIGDDMRLIYRFD